MTPEQMAANCEVADKLFSEQNFVAAAISGLVATILGAGIWAVIGVTAGYMVGYVAIALGALVGLTVQFAGRGIDSKFSALAGILAVAGCLLGNLFWAVLIEARMQGTGIVEVVKGIEFSNLVESSSKSVRFIDFVFWILAAAAAAYFARRPLSREQGLAVYVSRRT